MFDSLPPGMPRVISVGRLDLTLPEGLLLLTHDGRSPAGWNCRRPAGCAATACAASSAMSAGRTRQAEARDHRRRRALRPHRGGAGTLKGRTRGRWFPCAKARTAKRKVFEHLGLKVSRLIRVAYGARSSWAISARGSRGGERQGAGRNSSASPKNPSRMAGAGTLRAIALVAAAGAKLPRARPRADRAHATRAGHAAADAKRGKPGGHGAPPRQAGAIRVRRGATGGREGHAGTKPDAALMHRRRTAARVRAGLARRSARAPDLDRVRESSSTSSPTTISASASRWRRGCSTSSPGRGRSAARRSRGAKWCLFVDADADSRAPAARECRALSRPGRKIWKRRDRSGADASNAGRSGSSSATRPIAWA